jgi:hypothetical protein
MNKRTLIAGFIVLAIGIMLFSLGDHFSVTDNPSHLTAEFAVGFGIIGGILAFAGIVLLIYGAILPDPPVHWNNNL